MGEDRPKKHLLTTIEQMAEMYRHPVEAAAAMEFLLHVLRKKLDEAGHAEASNILKSFEGEVGSKIENPLAEFVNVLGAMPTGRYVNFRVEVNGEENNKSYLTACLYEIEGYDEDPGLLPGDRNDKIIAGISSELGNAQFINLLIKLIKI